MLWSLIPDDHLLINRGKKCLLMLELWDPITSINIQRHVMMIKLFLRDFSRFLSRNANLSVCLSRANYWQQWYCLWDKKPLWLLLLMDDGRLSARDKECWVRLDFFPFVDLHKLYENPAFKLPCVCLCHLSGGVKVANLINRVRETDDVIAKKLLLRFLFESVPISWKFLLPERRLEKYCNRIHWQICYFYVFSTFHGSLVSVCMSVYRLSASVSIYIA